MASFLPACTTSKFQKSGEEHKILERLIHSRFEPIVNPLLPREQAGFRRERSTVDQTIFHTQNIEDLFEVKKKAGAVFVNLTAAFDTVWHHGLTYKLLRLLPNNHGSDDHGTCPE